MARKRRKMKLAEAAERPDQVVYVILRHSVRQKDGRLKEVGKAKTITIHDATPSDVEAALRKGIADE